MQGRDRRMISSSTQTIILIDVLMCGSNDLNNVAIQNLVRDMNVVQHTSVLS